MKKLRGAFLPGAEASDSQRKKIRNDGTLPGAEASDSLRKRIRNDGTLPSTAIKDNQ